jgi:phosphotriesterase-related protein
MGSLKMASVAGAAMLMTAALAGGVAAQDADGRVFHTTAGPLARDQIGDVLAHQHMLVEYGANPPTAYVDADPEMVYEVIGPWLEEAKALGIGTFVDPTPIGVGLRSDIIKYAADRAELPTMMVTGYYREPFMPDWVYEASVEELADFMRVELADGVGETGVPAGWIKLAQNGTGMTLTERRMLEAACIVAQETDAAVGSHLAIWGSSAGPTALSVLDAFESFGCPLDEYRFLWIHAGVEAAATDTVTELADVSGHDAGMDYVMEALDRGAYVSFDSIGSPFWGGSSADYADNIARIQQMVDAGYEDRILLGSDTGWFDPGQPPGFELEQIDGVWTMVGTYAGDYSMVPGEFVPALQEAGFSEELITKLMQDNPWNVYSR